MSGRKKFAFTAVLIAVAVSASGCGRTVVSRFGTGEESADASASVSADKIYFEVSGEETGSAENSETQAAAEYSDGDDAAAITEYAVSADAAVGTAAEHYAYSTLTDEERAVYDEIVSAFSSRAESAQISTTDPAVMEHAYLAVRYDHCEFFWVGEFAYVTYTRGDVITSIDIRPGYTVSAEEQESLQRQVDAEADRMLADAPVNGSDFDKALYVYETLVRDVDYDVYASDGQTILSVFLDHASVCQGYSYATQYLLERLGIPCTTVTGTAEGEPHAWNLVFLDGDYYYIDTTWGNSQYVNRNDLEMEEIIPYKYVDYDYFGLTTQEISETHRFDGDIPLPVCTATADNYYVHEGLYIDSWDPDRIGEIFRSGYQSGESIVRVRFSDSGLYDQAMQYFLDDGNLFRWCDGLRSVRYLENQGSNVMVIVFP